MPESPRILLAIESDRTMTNICPESPGNLCDPRTLGCAPCVSQLQKHVQLCRPHLLKGIASIASKTTVVSQQILQACHMS